MAVTIIKSRDSDNQAIVNDDGELLVSGNFTANNSSVGPTGVTAPTDATLVAGVDPTGKLVPIAVNPDGTVVTTGGSNGFSILSPGYPAQVTVGTSSVILIASNIARKYAHIANNSSEAIFIQYQVSAALNKGVKIGPGGFFTLETDNLWRGDVTAIGLIAGQLIDVLEGI